MSKMFKRIMSIMLVGVLLLSTSMIIQAAEKEEKIYTDVDINDDFSDDKVVIVIFHEYSGLDKEWHIEDFPGVDIESIDYVTSLKDPNKEYPYLNYESYNQILALNLANPGKENVINAIKVLEENPVVKSAEPNYIFYIDDFEMYQYGDVDRDDKVNAKDALLILQASAGMIELSEEVKMYADETCDGIINAEDALVVLKKAANMPWWE